jgi:DNA-binding transcriptional ArsR family regulator
MKRKAKESLTSSQLQAVAELFAVLSEPTRLRILQMLQNEPATVGEIVQTLAIKQANASKQLGILHQAGVLSRQKNGTQVLYSIRMPLVFDLCSVVCDGLRRDAVAMARELK